MAENKLVWNINSILNGLSKEDRKKIKTNPADLGKKWGDLQTELLKKLEDLKKVDKSMHETMIAFSAAIKKFKTELPADQDKVYEIFRNLCQEYERAFRESIQGALNALQLQTKTAI